MNVEIGAEAAQFPEKEYINGIAFAVCSINDFFIVSLSIKGMVKNEQFCQHPSEDLYFLPNKHLFW
jgi:hypothetical protein